MKDKLKKISSHEFGQIVKRWHLKNFKKGDIYVINHSANTLEITRKGYYHNNFTQTITL